MFSLAHKAEARSLERPNYALVRDTGDGHGLPLKDDFTLLQSATQFIGHREVLINGVADIVQRLGLGYPLRRAARKAGHPYSETLGGPMQRNGVTAFSHSSEGTVPVNPDCNVTASKRCPGDGARRPWAG